MDLLPPSVQVMPVDRSTIMTRLRIHSDLLAAPESFIRERDLPIRTMKPTRGRGPDGPTRNLTLHVLTYRGIKVKLSKTNGAPLTAVTIDFNPGVCLRGHNGGILSLEEFLEALALLVKHLKPLLRDPDDWVDLVPGLRNEGQAYWSYLEVLFQCLDPDGTLLAGFRHARHPSIRTATRHWSDSIQFGGPRSKVWFSIYRKAFETVAHGKLPSSRLSDYRDVLRLEVRMKKQKLVHYFGNERNVEVIDGTERLCRFYPQDLIVGYRQSFSEFEGLFTGPSTTTSAPEDKIKPVEALGRMLAKVALDPRTTLTLPELLSNLAFYTKADIGEIRKAALAELSRRSSISLDTLFSDAAFRAQPGVYIEKLEEKIRHDLDNLFAGQLITSTYQPPDLPFLPVTQFPRYARM